MVGDPDDVVAQIEFGIDLIELGGFYQAADRGGAVAALLGASEQSVLATDRDAAQAQLAAMARSDRRDSLTKGTLSQLRTAFRRGQALDCRWHQRSSAT